MIAVIRLGLRLAGVGATPGAARSGGMRSLMVAFAAVLGTVLLLGVAAVSRSEMAQNPGTFISPGMKVLLASVVATIAVPVLVLGATAGRLSASLRDRRLANLRLLGLSPVRTRMVAVIETGTAAAVGALAGLLAFLAVRPLIAAWHPAGRDWTVATLRPTWFDYLLALILVPLAVVVVSALPQRLDSRSAMTAFRQDDQHRPRWWRLVPLVIGVVLALYVIISADRVGSDGVLAACMFAGMVSLGLGVVLAVPIFVRLVADLLVRRMDHPTLVIAGRRLQAQPAAMTRVVAGLLIGLFIVTGARALVVAFEQTSQYQAAARTYTTGQVGTFYTTMDEAPAIEQKVAELDGVRAVVTLPRLATTCDNDNAQFGCLTAVVGTCAELQTLTPWVTGCRDDQALWLVDPHVLPSDSTATEHLQWRRSHGHEGSGRGLSLPTPQHQLSPDNVGYEVFQADVFIPQTLPGVASLLPRTEADVLYAAEPGRDLMHFVNAFRSDGDIQAGGSIPDTSYYDFVAGLRALVWAIAAIILAVGLLTFTIAAIDRGISRRAEVVSLQLAGVSPQVLRRTQWIEAALPLAVGTALAIGLGMLAGMSYLAYGDILNQVPWRQTLTLAGIAVTAAVLVAGVTVIASSPRIRPELIRTE